jgi:hypothetical protein
MKVVIDKETVKVTPQGVGLQGPPGPQGEQGEPGADGVGDSYYTQSLNVVDGPSWTVTHNLGKFPSVTLVDSGGTVWIPFVDYIDEDSLTVTVDVPSFDGTVYLN